MPEDSYSNIRDSSESSGAEQRNILGHNPHANSEHRVTLKEALENEKANGFDYKDNLTSTLKSMPKKMVKSGAKTTLIVAGVWITVILILAIIALSLYKSQEGTINAIMNGSLQIEGIESTVEETTAETP